MMKTPINTIKNWFKTGLKPTQNQFWNWLDSFWHKDEKIPVESIGGIDEEFNKKQDTLVSGENIKTINNQPILGYGNIEIQGGGGSISKLISGYGIEVTADGKINRRLVDGGTQFVYLAYEFYDKTVNFTQEISDDNNMLNILFGGVNTFIDIVKACSEGAMLKMEDGDNYFGDILPSYVNYNHENQRYEICASAMLFLNLYMNFTCGITVDVPNDTITYSITCKKYLQNSLSEENQATGIIVTPQVIAGNNVNEYREPTIGIDTTVVATNTSVDSKINTRFAQTSAQGKAVIYLNQIGSAYILQDTKPTIDSSSPFVLVGTAVTTHDFNGFLSTPGIFSPKASYTKGFFLTGLRQDTTYVISISYRIKGILIYTDSINFTTGKNETEREIEFTIPSETTYGNSFQFAVNDAISETIGIKKTNNNENHTVNISNRVYDNKYSFTQRNGGIVYANEVFDSSLNKTQSEINANIPGVVELGVAILGLPDTCMYEGTISTPGNIFLQIFGTLQNYLNIAERVSRGLVTNFVCIDESTGENSNSRAVSYFNILQSYIVPSINAIDMYYAKKHITVGILDGNNYVVQSRILGT